MPNLVRIHEEAIAAGLGVVTVRWSGEAFSFDWESEPTSEQLAQANQIAQTYQDALSLNWPGLLSALQGSTVLGKCYLAAQGSPAVGAALNMVVTSLIGTRDLNNLEWAIGELRTALGANDFTAEELAWVNSQLSANGFALTLG